MAINDIERADEVMNDEYLYNLWQSSKSAKGRKSPPGLRDWVRMYRRIIDSKVAEKRGISVLELNHRTVGGKACQCLDCQKRTKKRIK